MNLLYNPKWILILSKLDKKGKTITQLAKETDTTYSLVYMIIKELKAKNLITMEKIGRKRVILPLNKELVKASVLIVSL